MYMLYLFARISQFIVDNFMPFVFFERSRQQKYDRTHRVNTEIQAGDDFPEYVPVDMILFMKCMNSLDLHMQHEVFADFGSGKGKAVLLAAQYGFPQIIGLEYNSELFNVLSQNIRAH